MIWIFVFVYVCLVVVVIQLVITYQKRGNNLRMKQEPIRRRIRLHKEGMVETIDKLHNAVAGRLEELDEEAKVYQSRICIYGKLLDRWRQTVPEEEELMHAEGLAADQDAEMEVQPASKVALGDRRNLLDMRNLIERLAGNQQELEWLSERVDRDTNFVSETLSRIEGRVGRPGQGNNSQQGD